MFRLANNLTRAKPTTSALVPGIFILAAQNDRYP
jgi:hypothetical protein